MTFEEEEQIEEIKHPQGAAQVANNNRARSASNPGRPAGSRSTAKSKETYSVSAIKDTADITNQLYVTLTSEAKKVFKKKRLSKVQKQMLERVCESVVVAKDKKDCVDTGKACIKNPDKILSLKPLPAVLEISAKHELDDYAAAILHHSRKNSLDK